MRAKGKSDPGRVREENQDVFAVREEFGLAILADGMGGARAGGLAAEIAVDAALVHLTDAARKEMLSPQHLSKALKLANDRVLGMASAVSAYRGMGTTLIAAAVSGAKGYVAHVGDSRVYRYRGGALHQLTKDHSLVQQWVDTGVIAPEEARYAPNRNVITRAIGAARSVQADLTEVDLATGDLLLLCSDGLTSMLTDEQIATLLASNAADAGLEDAAGALVDAANQAGGRDNVTVVLAQC